VRVIKSALNGKEEGKDERKEKGETMVKKWRKRVMVMFVEIVMMVMVKKSWRSCCLVMMKG
jgi:hypothetical protein